MTGDGDPVTRVRVRGVYATALTALLGDGEREVVQASPPIRERFDRAFPVAEHDVGVRASRDRRGVAVSGRPGAVAAVRDVLRGVDGAVLAWADRVPRGAVLDGEVTDTRRGGAVVDFGDGVPVPDALSPPAGVPAHGYLPFDDADGYVDTGDSVRVRVAEPASPWGDDHARVTGEVAVEGGLASLVRGADAAVVDTPPDGDALARTTELLNPEVPDGWGVAWHRAATDEDVTMDALGAALDRLCGRARDREDALAAAGDVTPGAVVDAPDATAWVAFDRAARFALDDVRDRVTHTIAGHHRVKAGARSASDAVDFAEALGADPDGFPFGAVAGQFGPAEGDAVAIQHGKPDGRSFSLGRGEVTARDSDGSLTVVREMTGGGSYDGLGVDREAGDTATTKFREGRGWYPTVYRDQDGARKGTYVNVCTPVEVFPDRVAYVDLHVDVLKYVDGTVEVVDRDELATAADRGYLPEPVADRAADVADRVAAGLREN